MFRIRDCLRVVALLAVLPVVAHAQSTPCPTTVTLCDGIATSWTTSTGTRTCPVVDPEYTFGELTFDHATGRSTMRFQYGGHAWILARDVYHVEDVAPGVPVTFDVRLDLVASVCGADGAHVQVTHGVGDATAYTQYDSYPFHWEIPCPVDEPRSLVLPVTVVGAAEFAVETRLESDPGSGGNGSVTARLSFEGLPPGARVRSCKGFVFDVPVPAIASSWGRVKSSYR